MKDRKQKSDAASTNSSILAGGKNTLAHFVKVGIVDTHSPLPVGLLHHNDIGQPSRVDDLTNEPRIQEVLNLLQNDKGLIRAHLSPSLRDTTKWWHNEFQVNPSHVDDSPCK